MNDEERGNGWTSCVVTLVVILLFLWLFGYRAC